MADTAADPMMDVIIIMDSASDHQMKLNELLTSLDDCKKQVSSSAENARKMTVEHFSRLKAKITRTIDERVESLLIDIDTARSTALNPLLQCEDLIRGHIETAVSIIKQGGQLLHTDNAGETTTELHTYKHLHETSTLNNLPAVPSLNDVAYISVQLRPSCSDLVIDKLSEEGLVLDRSPVIITDVLQCPGGLHVSWAESDDESSVDISEFCLQYCLCSSASIHTGTFHTAYTGPNTAYTLKGLRQHVQYLLRVSCRGEGVAEWATWSIPWPANTSLPHYQWSSGEPGYSLTNESRTLLRDGDIQHYPPLIYSSQPTYETGETITFRVLDDNDIGVEDGIGVCLEVMQQVSLKRTGSVFVSAKGTVYIDGHEMKNRLPSLVKDSSLTIHTEYLSSGKIRLSADIDEKQVTFDWTIEPITPTITQGFDILSLSQAKKSKHLYFVACFTKEDWRITVE